MAEKDATANSIEAGGSAALRLMKIFRIERAKIGSGAKVLRVREHGAEENQERVSESPA